MSAVELEASGSHPGLDFDGADVGGTSPESAQKTEIDSLLTAKTCAVSVR